MNVIKVALGDRGYDVVVGRGARDLLPEVMPDGVRRAAVVTDHAGDADLE